MKDIEASFFVPIWHEAIFMSNGSDRLSYSHAYGQLLCLLFFVDLSASWRSARIGERLCRVRHKMTNSFLADKTREQYHTSILKCFIWFD